MTALADNRKARFDYEILETFEAGLVLSGQEVKSAKGGHLNLRGSYVTLHNNEAYLINAHISAYPFAGELPGYDPTRSRKLLLRQRELKYLIGKTQEKGLTIVPTKVYTKNRLIKLEFALARGRKQYDKREAIKKRDVQRELRRTATN